LVGVGAAFDFHTGRVTQAPAWMAIMAWNGYSASVEPRRLWRRYLVYGAEFAALDCLNYWSEESSLTEDVGGTLSRSAAT